MLSAADIESVFRPILEYIRIQRDRKLADSIPRGLNFQEHYQCNCSFRRGAENQALENGVKENEIDFFHRWLEYEVIKGKQPVFNMLEHYTAGTNTCYPQLSFVKSL